ncbi:MAG: MotA/TolQ/ExbB proton channel family protein [Bdellovibrionales bacterium]|nr:MotA/TolQ/ExbB proton channel family protein [Bdellovibrionales bacterium]
MKERIFAMAHLADQAVLYLLILLSLTSLLVIIERFFVLGKIFKISKLQKNKLELALSDPSFPLDKTELLPDSLEAKIMTRALSHIKISGINGLEEQFNTFIKFEQPRLEKSLTFLATIGSNAPYIGLFGTVLGIMKSFNDLASSTNAGQQTVMAGISGALIATAAGLLVAIPNILAFNFFQKQVKSIISGIETFKEASMAFAKRKGN